MTHEHGPLTWQNRKHTEGWRCDVCGAFPVAIGTAKDDVQRLLVSEAELATALDENQQWDTRGAETGGEARFDAAATAHVVFAALVAAQEKGETG